MIVKDTPTYKQVQKLRKQAALSKYALTNSVSELHASNPMPARQDPNIVRNADIKKRQMAMQQRKRDAEKRRLEMQQADQQKQRAAAATAGLTGRVYKAEGQPTVYTGTAAKEKIRQMKARKAGPGSVQPTTSAGTANSQVATAKPNNVTDSSALN